MAVNSRALSDLHLVFDGGFGADLKRLSVLDGAYPTAVAHHHRFPANDLGVCSLEMYLVSLDRLDRQLTGVTEPTTSRSDLDLGPSYLTSARTAAIEIDPVSVNQSSYFEDAAEVALLCLHITFNLAEAGNQ